MKIEYKGKEYDVSLKTLFVNYNCSVKMVGRLTIEGAPKGYEYDKGFFELLEPIKKDLINQWLGSLDKPGTFPKLMDGNPIFPQDGGKYLPSVLLFADAINGYAGARWSQSFFGLLRELQKDSSYGCTIVGLPMYHNRTYGEDGSRVSKVWAIYPPSMGNKVYTPKNSRLTASLKGFQPSASFIEEEKQEIKLSIAS